MDIAKDMVEAEGSSLLLTDLETEDLIFNIVVGEKGNIIRGEKVPKGMGIAGAVAESGQCLIVDDAQSDPRHFKEIDQLSVFTTRNILAVPMKVMDKLIGVLEVVNSIGRPTFDEWDKKLITYIADQAAIAIHNRMLYDDLMARVEELTSLYEISQNLSFADTEETIFQNVVQTVAKSLGVEKASVMIYDEARDRLLVRAHLGLPGAVTDRAEVEVMESICGYVFRSGDPLIVSDIDKELSFPFLKRKDHYRTKSFISLPIRHKDRTIGVISLADKKSRACFDVYDLRVLTTIGTHVAEVYENIRYQRSVENQRRLAQEIDIASELQRKILPAMPATVGDHRLAAFNRPAKDVGGDFFDFKMLGESKYSVLVADVSGKGIPAALFMGSSRNLLRAEARINNQPGMLLHSSNRYIYEDSEHGMFVTLFYMVVDMHNSLITYGSAGHNDQLIIKRTTRDVVRLNARGMALGMQPDSEYEEKVTFFEPGDWAVLFTDGVLEYLGEIDIDAGEARLIDIAMQYLDRGPQEFIDCLRGIIEETKEQSDFIDDFTIVAIQL